MDVRLNDDRSYFSVVGEVKSSQPRLVAHVDRRAAVNENFEEVESTSGGT